jgi:NAD-dependent dihydropyrimidine dehydrogenase PreA subunit
VTYVITEPCVDVRDRACVDECPVDCIYEGLRMLYIHPAECIDCGACEPVCPVEAIYREEDVPEQWREYIDANAAFFDELGAPGGASKIGPVPWDVGPAACIPAQPGSSRRSRPAL